MRSRTATVSGIGAGDGSLHPERAYGAAGFDGVAGEDPDVREPDAVVQGDGRLVGKRYAGDGDVHGLVLEVASKAV